MKQLLMFRLSPIALAAFIILILVQLLSCNGPPPPCRVPMCEETGGNSVIDGAGTCVCECPQGTQFVPGEGCVSEEPPCVVPNCEETGGTIVPLDPADPTKCKCECEGNKVYTDDGCVCPVGTVWDEHTGLCIEPPPGPNPADYLTSARAGTMGEKRNKCGQHTGLVENLCYDLQENAWAGWRDPMYVANNCGFGCAEGDDPIFPLSGEEMYQFGEYGKHLQWGERQGEFFIYQLAKTNRRCKEDHPEHDPRFCGRSEVRREAWNEYSGRLQSHLLEANQLRKLAQGDPIRETCAYDSIMGWCGCRLKADNFITDEWAPTRKPQN